MDAYVSGILSLAGIYAIMAISVNIISGITGQLSLGQAGFMALGAYATILLNSNAHLPLWMAVILAGIITAFFGFLIGNILCVFYIKYSIFIKIFLDKTIAGCYSIS